jgi:hypothetical protein
MTTWKPTFASCDDYLNERTGKYEYRAIRYRKAADWMVQNGLDDSDTICDIGAGWTELDYCLRVEYDWKGRYIPIDGGISDVDLNFWKPERDVDFFVGLEIIEHLYEPLRLLEDMKPHARKGIVVSTPNPKTVDVFGIDDTHVIEVHREMLESVEFAVTEELLYGGVFSDGKLDAYMGYWIP